MIGPTVDPAVVADSMSREQSLIGLDRIRSESRRAEANQKTVARSPHLWLPITPFHRYSSRYATEGSAREHDFCDGTDQHGHAITLFQPVSLGNADRKGWLRAWWSVTRIRHLWSYSQTTRSQRDLSAPHGFASVRVYGAQTLELARQRSLTQSSSIRDDRHQRLTAAAARTEFQPPIIITTAGLRVGAYRAGAWEFLSLPLTPTR
jgi:hypothetical protein